MAKSKQDKFDSQLSALARYAKALSHPARLAILETLAKRKRCVCGEIVEILPLAQSTVSQHLRELKDAGLIVGETEGLNSCYCLDAKAIKKFESLTHKLFDVLNQNCNLKRCC